MGYRIGNSVLIIRQHPPTDDPNPRITLQVQDARETEKRLTELAVTISDPVKLYEDKFWVGGFLDGEGTNSGFVPTPNSQALAGRASSSLAKPMRTGRVEFLFCTIWIAGVQAGKGHRRSNNGLWAKAQLTGANSSLLSRCYRLAF